MAKRYYQLQELVDAVNERLGSLPELDQTEFTRRTVYYYVQEGLLPRLPGLRRGPRTRYRAEFVDRLLFIRRLQSQEALSLDHIREVLLETPPDTIRRVANGEERLRLAHVGEATALPGEQTIALSAMAAMESDELLYANGEEAPGDRQESGAEEFRAGPRASLQVLGPVSARQRRQIQQAAELIETLLEEDED